MTKTSGEFEREFIQTVKRKTGRTVEQWLPVVKRSGFTTQMEITDWLKTEYKFNHLDASLLAGLYLNNGKAVYQNENSLFENQFIKCEKMRPLFVEVSKQILETFSNAQLIPKKTYLSYATIKEFVALNIGSDEIRIGMDLGNLPFSEIIQRSKLIGPVRRISHMTIIKCIQQFDQELIGNLQLSYKRSHQRQFYSFLL